MLLWTAGSHCWIWLFYPQLLLDCLCLELRLFTAYGISTAGLVILICTAGKCGRNTAQGLFRNHFLLVGYPSLYVSFSICSPWKFFFLFRHQLVNAVKYTNITPTTPKIDFWLDCLSLTESIQIMVSKACNRQMACGWLNDPHTIQQQDSFGVSF